MVSEMEGFLCIFLCKTVKAKKNMLFEQPITKYLFTVSKTEFQAQDIETTRVLEISFSTTIKN